jgi:diguanylate cyclase (GGDEF)-like protein
MFIASVRNNKILLKTMLLQYENLNLVRNLSIANSKLLKSNKMMEKHENELAKINELNYMLQSCKELDESYAVIGTIANQLFTGFNGSLAILNPETNRMEVIREWGDNCRKYSSFLFQDCWGLRNGHEYHVNDSSKEIICNHIDKSTASYVCLPLYGQYGVAGVLTLCSSEINSLNNYIVRIAMSFNEVIQLSLTNLSLRDSLYEQTMHDALTGLYNRRYLDTILNVKINCTISENKKLCVAMLDLDHFKRINDTYGHEAGDEVLKMVGKKLSNLFRHEDIAIRYGGEEFLVVLGNTTANEAFNQFQQIRNELKNHSIYFAGQRLPIVTVSIGIAEVPCHGKDAKDVLQSADHALYMAKEEGRDRVVCFNSEINIKVPDTHS